MVGHVHVFTQPHRAGVNEQGVSLYTLRCRCGVAEGEDDLPNDVRTLLNNIAKGNVDPYIEAILNELHNRKRTLRGTPGFTRPVSR